jgi:hypothetical protein
MERVFIVYFLFVKADTTWIKTMVAIYEHEHFGSQKMWKPNTCLAAHYKPKEPGAVAVALYSVRPIYTP